jgi:pyruvate-formate lyase-activating enzyme
MDKDLELFKVKINNENLVPNPFIPGDFIIKEVSSSDGIGHLFPNNWVFHDSIVKKVLEGKYNELNPVCAEFVTTLNCSNRCGICGYKPVKILLGCWEKNIFGNDFVHVPSYESALNFMNEIIYCGVKGLIFTGGGEPFLFNGVEDLVLHATNKSVDSVVYTNGNCVTKKRLEKLIEASPLLVRVSLNAGTEEVYNNFHNPLNSRGALGRTLKTIETLAEGSVNRNPKVDVGVSVVINEINQDDLVNAALRVSEIAQKYPSGIKFMAFRPEFDYYTFSRLGSDLLDKTYGIVEGPVRKILENSGVNVSNVTCRYNALKRDTRNYDECRASGFILEAGPTNNLFFCCDRNLNMYYHIGNYRQNGNSISNIHHGEKRRKVLSYVNDSNCGVCPRACKSHETNNQFQKIEELREKGEMYKVKLWIDEQRKMPPPKMVNFP